MNIVIPMAGRGSRLRPHTLTVPKPLIPIAGKPIVQRLAEDLISMSPEKVENIAFVIGDFGEQVPKDLHKIAESLGAKGHVFYQDQPLGTAHAVLCAKDFLKGKTIVAFADTLFDTDYQFNSEDDGTIIVQKVEDPRAYGVVQLDEAKHITNFVEKPEEFISDLAIIGIYYFKEAEKLRADMQYLIDNDIKDKGEYQLTNALESLKVKGAKFGVGEVKEWLDCGNKNAAVNANQRVLNIKKEEFTLPKDLITENATVIEPCYIGNNVSLRNAIIGPNVSIGHNCSIENSVISNSLIQNDTIIRNKVLEHSMLGSKVNLNGVAQSISIGDFCESKLNLMLLKKKKKKNPT